MWRWCKIEFAILAVIFVLDVIYVDGALEARSVGNEIKAYASSCLASGSRVSLAGGWPTDAHLNDQAKSQNKRLGGLAKEVHFNKGKETKIVQSPPPLSDYVLAYR